MTAAIPPNNVQPGDPNHILYHNNISDMLTLLSQNANFAGLARVFYLDAYGADSTGATLSDTAWANCYSAATAALQTHGGAIIVAGAGYYQFSVNTVAVSDRRIGLQGQGPAATRFYTTGNTGIIVDVATSGALGDSAAPIRDFTVDGSAAGSGVTGVRYGNRNNGSMTNVVANLCSARGFWFNDAANHSEGSNFALNANQCAVNYDVDHADLDYGQMFFHSVSTQTGQNNISLRVINGSQISGSSVRLAGNITASSTFTSTALQIGASGSDTSFIAGCGFNFSVECDTSAGTVQDMVVQGASGSAGLRNCNGVINFINVGSAFTAGSVTAPAVVTFGGFCAGPIFSSHGTRTALGTGNVLFTYAG